MNQQQPEPAGNRERAETSGSVETGGSAETSGSAELVSLTLLMDFYGVLLTPRQTEVLALHCNDDLSLAEIAQELGISRQAAHDAIQTGRNLLIRYEEKLALVARFARQRALVDQAREQVQLAREQVQLAREAQGPTAGHECLEKAETLLDALREML